MSIKYILGTLGMDFAAKRATMGVVARIKVIGLSL